MMYADPRMLPNPQQGLPFYRKLAIWISAIIHLVVLVTCIGAPTIGSNGPAYLIIGLMVSFFASYLAYKLSDSRILHFVASLLVGTFALKVPLCLYLRPETHLAILSMTDYEVGPQVVLAFVRFSFAMLAFVMTALMIPLVFPHQQKKQYVSGVQVPATDDVFFKLGVACFLVLVLRFACIFILDIATIGVTPRQILFPGFTGLLKFISSVGAVVLLSSFLSLALSRNKFSSFAIAMSMFVAYMAMDLSIGKKRTMFIIVLCLIWLLTFLEDKKLQARLKPLVPVFLVFAILMYGPAMTLRRGLHKGRIDHTEALGELMNEDTYGGLEFGVIINKVVRRFNGLDLLVITQIATEDKPLGAIYLINGQFGATFAHEIMGVNDEVIIGMGSTLWGFFFAVLGKNYMFLAGVMLAVCVNLGERICDYAGAYPDAKAVFQLNYCLLMQRFAASSGMFLFQSKELFILVLSMYFAYKISWGSSTMRNRAKQIAAQMHAQMQAQMQQYRYLMPVQSR